MVRRLLKNGYFTAMTIGGVDRSRRDELVKNSQAAVLNLHRVTPEPSPYWPPMHPELFKGLLKYLNKYFEVRSIHDLDEKHGKRPVAVLSFDDGYYDFIEYALPLIKKYKMRANMNVIPQCVETGMPIWNVRLYDFLASASVEEAKQIKVEGFRTKLAGGSPREKLRFGIALSKFLKLRPRTERSELFRPVEELMANKEFTATKMMIVDEVRQIAGEVDLGAHSFSHESMEFEDDTFFDDDVSKCREFFVSKLGIPMEIYAFPNGSYRPNQIEILRRNGVAKVLVVDEKLSKLGSPVITRITMYGDSPSEIRMRAVGAV